MRLINLPLPLYNVPVETGAAPPAVTPPAAPATDAPVAPATPEPPKAPEPPTTLVNDPAAKAEGEGEKKVEPPKAPEPFNVKDIKLPEGFQADEAQLSKFGEIVGNDKLSPKERGEALISLYAEGVKAVSEANTKLWSDLQTKWRDEVKADKEVGGDKLAPTTTSISKAIDTLGPELAKGFRTALDFTGAGNNPFIIRGLAKMAAALTEGGHVPGTPGSGKQNIASVFFPNSPEFNEKGNG